jgi:prepilin signal peptidase PulO-like enzyme (type II secretory pathway)
MVEAITGIAFVLFAWQFNFHISEMLVFELVVACTLIVIAVFDFKHYLILDKVIAFGSGIVALQIIYAISILKQPLFDMASPLIQALLGIAVISGFFGLQYLISHGRWIGLGDVKLGLFLGALFGLSRSLVLLLIAYIAGAVVGVALIVWDKKKLSSRLPFGIFLGFAGIVVMLYGQQILDWYLALIGF